MESNRQKKIAGIIQKDIADILQKSASSSGMNGVIISVTKVSVTVDLSLGKVYLSVFPNDKAKSIHEGVQSNKTLIKHELSQRTRHQMRRVPNLEFYIDDSLEYIDNIERSLKAGENPIEDQELLKRRKKS